MSTDRTTEILNYLSAISREIGAFRTEVKGRFEQVEGRLDGLEAEMRAGFQAVRGDVRHLAQKIEVLTQDSLDLRADQRTLRVRVDALERKQV